MDEEFNILKTDDIPMSPGRGKDYQFYLKGRNGEKDLELAYEYDFYFSQPEFPHFYQRIKKLMEDPNTICFAYSMQNDIRHIDGTCRRYKLEPLNYTCYDVQMMVGKYLKIKTSVSLHEACTKIVGADAIMNLQEHLSRDDAEMERLIFEKLCEINEKSPQEFLDECGYAKTNSIAFIKRAKERAERKRIRSEGYKLYRSLVCPDEELDKEENIGRRYNISGELKASPKELNEVIDLIKKKNGLFSNLLSKTDYFIVLDEDNKNKLMEILKDVPFTINYLTYQEFMNNGGNA